MKTALVLGGGGSRGAYEIGVCKALEELEIEIDMVFGTSVGAINGAMIAQGDLALAEKLWLELSTDMVFDIGGSAHDNSGPAHEDSDSSREPAHDIVSAKTGFTAGARSYFNDAIQDKVSEFTERIGDKIRERFGELDIAGMPAEEAAGYLREIITNGGASNTGLMDMMKKYIREEDVRSSHISYGLVVTELPALGGHYVYTEDIPAGQLPDYIMASASCFPAVQVCDIDGRKFIDGGYYDNLPVKMALERGADSIIAVNLKAVGILRQEFIEQAKANCKSFIHLKPSLDAGNMLTFDAGHTTRLITLGYLDTMRRYGRFDGKKYTFEKGVFSESEISAADSLAVKYAMDPARIYDRSGFLDALLEAVSRR